MEHNLWKPWVRRHQSKVDVLGHGAPNVKHVRMFGDVRYFMNIRMFVNTQMFGCSLIFECSFVRLSPFDQMFANFQMLGCSNFNLFSKIHMFRCSMIGCPWILLHKSVFASSNVRRTWTNIRILNKNDQSVDPWNLIIPMVQRVQNTRSFGHIDEKWTFILNNSFKHKLHGPLKFRIWA